MGRRCCCNPACKICNCSLGNSVPEEAKVYDFTHSKFTLSGFEDWSYDYTYNNSFGTYSDLPGLNYVGYDPRDVYYNYNRIRYHNIFHGNGSVRYKVSLTGLSLLNGEHDFNKSDNCRFVPNEYSSYLGEVIAESFVEINVSGNIYTFFVVPPYYGQENFLPGLYCSSTDFGCPFYRPRFYSAIIPPDWSGTLGTRIKFDVYAYKNDYFPIGGTNCVQILPEIYFKFIIKETEPIVSGVFTDYGKLLLSQSVEGDCSNYNAFGCPTNTCEWTTGRGSWSTCKDPFDNVLFGYDVIQRTFQYDSCWWRCVRYENHTNFLPIDMSFRDSLGRTRPDMFFTLNTGMCGNLFYTLNTTMINPDGAYICENWNGANQTISDDYSMGVDFSDLSADPSLPDNTAKIYPPCEQMCGASGTGIGYSQNYFFLQNIFDYLFHYNTVFPYDPPGIVNNPVSNPNYKVQVPKLFWANWGTFTLMTYNGYPASDHTNPPFGLYECSLTKPDIPNISWSRVSDLVHSAQLAQTSSEDPYFVLPPPLQIEVSALYD